MPFPLGNMLLDLKSRVNHHPSLFGVSSIWGILPCSGSLAYFVCNSIHWFGLFPKWNSTPSKSISHKEFYSWSLFLVILLSWWIGPTRTTGVYLVCVCLPSIWVSCSSCSSSFPAINLMNPWRSGHTQGVTPHHFLSWQRRIVCTTCHTT
jgi:hypothetical protein